MCTLTMFCLVATFETSLSNAAVKPNVIVIMADDLGYNDLGCYGGKRHKTPTLDKLADQGVRLTSFYAGATVCTPSRMALLSGSYPARLGWEGGVVGYKMPQTTGLSRDVVTIAEVFKGAGYRTAICGKWHVGGGDLLPMNQGFDHTFYTALSNNQTKKLWRGNQLVANPFDNRRLSEQFTAEAIRFIDANKDRAFFLYLPYTAPHFPAQAHPDWNGRSTNGAYGDVVEEMDSRVGELLAALKRHKIDQNTIVLFASDNGPEPGQRRFASASPFSGLKWSAREGGTRVPCIVRWPAVIKAGWTCDDMVAAIDLLPTLAHACGVDFKLPSTAQKLDGVNVWPTLIGKNTPHARTDLLYWHGWGVAQAIRVGEWKLHFGQEQGVPGKGTHVVGTDKGPVLINLKTDPQESVDLSRKHPEQVNAMLALARKRLQDIHDHAMPLGTQGDRPNNWTPKRKWGKWLLGEEVER